MSLPLLPKQLPASSRRAVAAVASSSLFKPPSSPSPTWHSIRDTSSTHTSVTNSRSITTRSTSNTTPRQGLNLARNTANMSTMPAQHGHSEPCCNVPPIVASGYDAKGTYEELGGYKTYVTGPEDATKGILHVFDIFGYYPQTLQGADILATSDASQKYRVFMPDLVKGEPVPMDWFPPDNEEKQKKLGDWFQSHSPPDAAAKVPAYVKALEAKYPNIKSWGVIGFCWGGKVVSLVTSSDENPFKAGVECHPAMVDPSEAEKIKVPLMMLASKDEPADDVKKFEKNLKSPGHVEIFGDQIHGWMSARSDLSNDRVKAEYKRGYEAALKFFSKHV
ncbi:alpha/beta-hydrolase [Xylariaceae sp. FL0804]|nr:alpha/beta-hydrolase [Xylariaceae sp. FL0804]